MNADRAKLREGLFQQAKLYRGVTREQWERGREGGRLTPADDVAAGILLENANELAQHHADFGRPDAAAQILADARANLTLINCGAQLAPVEIV